MSSPTTLKQQFEQLKILRRRLAVWEAIHHITDEKFISKDGSKVSGLKADSGDMVSEDEIEDVLKQIAEGPITDLKAEIETIEQQEVVVITESRGQA